MSSYSQNNRARVNTCNNSDKRDLARKSAESLGVDSAKLPETAEVPRYARNGAHGMGQRSIRGLALMLLCSGLTACAVEEFDVVQAEPAPDLADAPADENGSFWDDEDTDSGSTTDIGGDGTMADPPTPSDSTETESGDSSGSPTDETNADDTDSSGSDSTMTDPNSDQWPQLAGLDIDLNNLLNYEDQPIPNYIRRDNTPVENPITNAGATLGRVLFYDPRLSSNNTISCASCHKQSLAFGDDRALSPGVNGDSMRHSMRLINVRFAESTRFRWDRQARSLEAQMLGPIQDHLEMGYSGENGDPDLDDLIEKLSLVPAYRVLFNKAWGDEMITEERVADSLAQFVRSIQSFDSKYDAGRALVNRDDLPFPNFTNDENRGKSLFLNNFGDGGFNCGACHRAPEFDIDPDSGNNGLTTAANPNASGSNRDFSVVRSPTLRDMVRQDGQLNGGMFHTGRANTIRAVLAQYNLRDVDPNNPNLDRRLIRGGRPQRLNAPDEERRQIEAFIRTLAGSQVYQDVRWSNPFSSQP